MQPWSGNSVENDANSVDGENDNSSTNSLVGENDNINGVFVENEDELCEYEQRILIKKRENQRFLVKLGLAEDAVFLNSLKSTPRKRQKRRKRSERGDSDSGHQHNTRLRARNIQDIIQEPDCNMLLPLPRNLSVDPSIVVDEDDLRPQQREMPGDEKALLEKQFILMNKTLAQAVLIPQMAHLSAGLNKRRYFFQRYLRLSASSGIYCSWCGVIAYTQCSWPSCQAQLYSGTAEKMPTHRWRFSHLAGGFGRMLCFR